MFPWSTIAVVRPLPLETAAPTAVPEPAADPEPDLEPPPSSLVVEYSSPPRPRVAPTAPSTPAGEARPEAPQIAPQLTPQETSAAQQQTNQSLNIAQRNIESTQGKNLNATQTDLASKVRSFIAEAQQASHAGDWTRARDAAKKAEVLSAELVSSL